MNGDNPRSTARIMGHPIHPMLVPFPITLFIAALATDAAFVIDGSALWARASLWLVGAGIVTALLAALFGLADFLGDARVRALSDARMHMIGNLLAVAIEAVNLVLRLGDERAAGGAGIILSAVAVAILGFTGWKGGELVFRHGVGVASRGAGGQR
ncbi:DUF2231 domain-containing protein [Sphingomonas parva]|uniref:DUF2231 domain-containing protein n=1 Tax=Sphingomonas parva TaxID=2555898 RepID=A0A4Y8ZT83_9SPHN|nr:DUF2231 domain-containing protein [Sphingomonas parva]TFI57969.1 DUF2231 domain-containing protein [Sphingomonas parva]